MIFKLQETIIWLFATIRREYPTKGYSDVNVSKRIELAKLELHFVFSAAPDAATSRLVSSSCIITLLLAAKKNNNKINSKATKECTF